MAFGLLSSSLPAAKTNTVLYGSTATDLVEANVSISHKNHHPVKVSVGISTNNVDVDYILYHFPLNRGETFETDTIYFSRGESIIVRSTDDNTNFVLYGSALEDSTDSSGLLGKQRTTGREHKILYTSPTDVDTTLTISANNLGSHPSEIRIGITSAGTYELGTGNYIEYGREIYPGQNYVRSEVKLTANQSLVVCSSDDSSISFVAYGKAYNNAGGDGGSGSDLRVFGNLRVDQKIGVGTNPIHNIDVIGNGKFTEGLTVGGALTAFQFTGDGAFLTNLKASELFGPLPAIDGSALTGVVATGSGVEIRDDGSPVGTAATISFDNGLSVTFGSGISSVRLSDTINVGQKIQVAGTKFEADGISGNVSIANSLSVGAGASFGGTINALNNKVINVGLATSPGDVTNKKYVDSRTILFSIALS